MQCCCAVAQGGTLVVCPASLMQQWAGEVSKHCTSHAASVCLHHGALRAVHAHRLATYDVVLTTYNILQRDNEKVCLTASRSALLIYTPYPYVFFTRTGRVYMLDMYGYGVHVWTCTDMAYMCGRVRAWRTSADVYGYGVHV